VLRQRGGFGAGFNEAPFRFPVAPRRAAQ
jgi:hypothetical protein